MAPEKRMSLRVTKTNTSQGVTWPERPISETVYRVVESRDAREGHVPVAGGVTAFGRTYQVRVVTRPESGAGRR